MDPYFRQFAQWSSAVAGSAWAFITAVSVLAVWGATGPMFEFSDTWQLVVNTLTTVVTFLMVFLIQNTQNRDAKVIHLKLDELLRAVKSARTGFVNLEELSDAELRQVAEEFHYLHQRYGDQLSRVHRAMHDTIASRNPKNSKARK